MNPSILRVDGEVQTPLDLQSSDLAAVDAAFQIPDVSKLDPKRRGRAVRLAGLLQLAGAKPAAQYLTLHASRDDFHASIPLAAVRERAILIYELDGQPLAESAGGPVRLLIPDYAACKTAEVDECANVKFVDRIELTAERGFDNRPHDEQEHDELHERQS